MPNNMSNVADSIVIAIILVYGDPWPDPRTLLRYFLWRMRRPTMRKHITMLKSVEKDTIRRVGSRPDSGFMNKDIPLP